MTPRVAIAAAAVIGFLAAALTTALLGIPTPQIHDESAYLLQADTFAHARLTNPAHPMWSHFETFYVLQRPTYQAKYQPGQAAFLAFGQMLGRPIAGVWLAHALACAAVTWMLIAWSLPVAWAFAGGMIAALHPTMLMWGHSYWGGAVAVLGGALAIGASRRLITERRFAISLLLGMGVVLLAYSRPFEGAVLLLALAVAAASLRVLSARALLPAIAVVIAGLLFNAYYDLRVTGHAARLPYVEYESQYAVTPAFIVQHIHPIAVRQTDMRRLTVDWAYPYYEAQHSLTGFVAALPRKAAIFCNAAFQMIPDALLVRVPDPAWSAALSIAAIVIELFLLLPLLFLPRDRLLGIAVLILVAVFFVALTPTVVPLPHYAAPVAPLLLMLWLAGLRAMRCRRTFALIAAFIAMIAVALWLRETARTPYRWPEVKQRLDIARAIAEQPGEHLVLVRYTIAHENHFSWIQNLATIDAQRIIWARDLGDNTALLRYYASRTVWRVIAGDPQPRLMLVRPRAQQKGAGSQAAPATAPTS